MKVSLLGCGYWGGIIAQKLSDKGLLSSVFDTQSDRASAISIMYNVPVLDIHNSKADVAYIAIPYGQRSLLVEEALNLCKVVILEKPACEDLKSIINLYSIADKANTVLRVGHIMAFDQYVHAISGFISEYGLTKVKSINCIRIGSGRNYVNQDIILDFAVHDITILQSLIGPIYPNWSKVHTYSKSLGNNDIDINFCSHSQINVNIICSKHSENRNRKTKVTFENGMIVYDEIEKKITADFNNGADKLLWEKYASSIEPSTDKLSAMIDQALDTSKHSDNEELLIKDAYSCIEKIRNITKAKQ